jgi:hypothetical protein
MNRNFILTLLTLAALTILASCTDSTTAEDNYINIKITQPAADQVVTDSVLRVLTEVKSNCGCSASVSFTLDSTFVSSDFVPQYSCDLDLRQIPAGRHVIHAHAVVVNKAEGRDSVSFIVSHK